MPYSFFKPEAKLRKHVRMIFHSWCNECSAPMRLQVDDHRMCYEINQPCNCGDDGPSWAGNGPSPHGDIPGYIPCHVMDKLEEQAYLQGWAEEQAERIIWGDEPWITGVQWGIVDSMSLPEAFAGNTISDGDDTEMNMWSIAHGS